MRPRQWLFWCNFFIFFSLIKKNSFPPPQLLYFSKQPNQTKCWGKTNLLGRQSWAGERGEIHALTKLSQLTWAQQKNVASQGIKTSNSQPLEVEAFLLWCVCSCRLKMQLSCLGKLAAVRPQRPGPRGRDQGQEDEVEITGEGERERDNHFWASPIRQIPDAVTADEARESHHSKGNGPFP